MTTRLTRPGVKGVTYDFQDLRIEINGNRVLEITSVDWRLTRNTNLIFGQGEELIGFGQGEMSVEGSLSAKISPNLEAEIAKVANPRTGQKSQSFVEWGPVMMVLVYGTGVPYTRRSFHIVFTDEGESGSQGDTGLEASLSFIGTLRTRG